MTEEDIKTVFQNWPQANTHTHTSTHIQTHAHMNMQILKLHRDLYHDLRALVNNGPGVLLTNPTDIPTLHS
jgi:hypothetical protein